MAFINQSLSEGLLDGGLGCCADYAGAALITLAVVIGTYVKEGVLVVVVPLYDAVQDMVVGYGRGGIGLMIGRTELCQYPAA